MVDMFSLSFNKIRALIVLLAAAVSLGFLSGCSGSNDGKRVAVVTIPPQKYFLEQIVGDKLEVKTLLPQSANPENYEPGMSHLVDLERASVYFTMGNIGFESAILPKLSANNPDLLIADSGEGLNLLTGTHDHCGHHHHHGHDCGAPDPHTWSSVKNARVIAANMAAVVQRLDPDNSDYYHKRLLEFDARLDSMDKAIEARLAPHRGEHFLIWHPSLSYFARDYGLEQIAVGQEGKESSAISLGEKIERASAHGASLFFYQRDFDSRQVEALNDCVNAQIVEINPMNENWEAEINLMVDALDGKK